MALPSCAGSVSDTGAPLIFDGPELETTIVYVAVVPATSDRLPSVLVMKRSAFGFSDVTSVAELFPGLGSSAPTAAATVAVLAIVPVAEPTIVPVTVNVTLPPTVTSIAWLIAPAPLAGQLPPTAVHVHVTPESTAGTRSTRVAPVAADGPALVTTTV